MCVCVYLFILIYHINPTIPLESHLSTMYIYIYILGRFTILYHYNPIRIHR